MKNSENSVWRFFASVKLALFTLLILSVTSIIGTLIPQKNPPAFYIEEYGPNLARFFEILDVPSMYNSWWFVSLLLLFSVNLIVCTIDRLPNVWRMVVMDNLETPLDRLEKMPQKQVFFSDADQEATARTVGEEMQAGGWKTASRAREGETLLFAQKTPWSRLGVYAVHLSILIIFAGAIIGSVGGYRGSVMIPEGDSTDTVYEHLTSRPIPLGFTVRCDEFGITYYDDGGTPKEFRSLLTITDPELAVPFTRPIIVNDPLTHKGVTFYQSSYQPLQGFVAVITDKTRGTSESFRIPFGERIPWAGTGIEFGIINQQQRSRMGNVSHVKVWFSDGHGEASSFWMADKSSQTIVRPAGVYDFSIKQIYATGLQATKDPGVWTVYFGCTLMLLGLYAAFFLAHRRIWVAIRREGERTRVLLCGTSSKNTFDFEKDFAALAARLEKNPGLRGQ
jgi:cytochrome c biogenesis protein